MRELLFGRCSAAIAGALVCALAGLAAWAYLLSDGLLGTTGMGNAMCWGLLIAVFAFLVGFGAGSQIVASVVVLSRREAFAPWVLPLQAAALGGGIGAAVAVVADLGSPQNILAMLLAPNPASPLTWDMVALTAFIVVSAVCLVATARRWRTARAWMAIGLIAALALQVVEGLLFSTQGARAWWHSVVMPVDFLAVAVVCGLALATVMAALSRRAGAIDAARTLAVALAVAVAVHLVLALAELALLATEGGAGATSALSIVGAYAPLYALELGLSALAAILVAVRRRKANAKLLATCAVLVGAGIFAHRLMLLYPALSASTLFVELSNAASPAWAYPLSTGLAAVTGSAFQVAQAYVPAPLEWASALLPAGLAVAVALVAANVARGIARERSAADGVALSGKAKTAGEAAPSGKTA